MKCISCLFCFFQQNANFELCDTNRTSDICDNAVSDSSLVNYYAVFILAQVVHGLGASPLYTLGITYIDDNVSSAASGIYIGKGATRVKALSPPRPLSMGLSAIFDNYTSRVKLCSPAKVLDVANYCCGK